MKILIANKYAVAAVSLMVAVTVLLWSFNTLSELYGGPQAQLKHVVAAISVVLAFRWSWNSHEIVDAGNRYRHRRGRPMFDKTNE